MYMDRFSRFIRYPYPVICLTQYMLSQKLHVKSLDLDMDFDTAFSAAELHHMAFWSTVGAAERGSEHCRAECKPACVVRRHSDLLGV